MVMKLNDARKKSLHSVTAAEALSTNDHANYGKR